MKRVTWTIVGLAAALAGCASPWAVDRFEAPEANVASRSAFFLKGGELGTTVAMNPAVSTSVDTAIRSAITTELAHKGYTEVADAAAAQMIVSYQVAGTRRFVIADERRVGAPSATTVLSPSEIQPPPASALPREQSVRDGTVIVFVDDPASGRLIWRGTITAETRVGSTEAGIRTIADMAHHITQEFPARAGQPAK
jgi:hypothetical protein